MRRIGVLTIGRPDDPEVTGPLAAFQQALAAIGLDRRTQHADRLSLGREAMRATFASMRRNWPRSRRTSSWLVGSATVASLLQATRTVPIVFADVADPVGAGFVDSLARPGGNATGFMQFEYSMSGKWLELLKEIAPGVTRWRSCGMPATAAGIGQFAVSSQWRRCRDGVEPDRLARRRRDRARRRGIRAPSNGGLIVTSSRIGGVHRELIIALAARHKLPAVYSDRYFVTAAV